LSFKKKGGEGVYIGFYRGRRKGVIQFRKWYGLPELYRDFLFVLG
jgi:hypothetical protein